MDEQVACRHTQCNWKNRSGTIERFISRGKTAKKGIYNHERVLIFHPCCSTDQSNCPIILSKRRRNNWTDISSKSKFHKPSESLTKCAHTSCTKVFSTINSMRNHVGQSHGLCNQYCARCTTLAPRSSSPPPAEPELPPSLDGPTKCLELLSSISRGSATSTSTEEMGRIITDSLVIGKTSDGTVLVTSFVDQVDHHLKNILKCLSKCGVTVLPIATIEWISSHSSILGQLLSADFLEAQRLLSENSQLADRLWSDIDRLEGIMNVPTIQALLEMKDKCKISDLNFNHVAKVFRLPKTHRLAAIRAYRLSLKKNIFSRTEGGRGFTRDVIETIRAAVKLQGIDKALSIQRSRSEEADANPTVPETDSSEGETPGNNDSSERCLVCRNPRMDGNPTNFPSIRVKISYDEGCMTRKRRMEVGTLDILSCKSLSTCKSWKNSHILTLFAGNKCGGSVETYDVLKLEMKSIFSAIKQFHKSPFIEIDNQRYHVDLFITLDLACLVESLGMLNVWKHNCTWRCPWCLVQKHSIADFTVDSWAFRDIHEMRSIAKKHRKSNSERTRRDKAREQDFQGIWNKPLINFPVWKIVPCMLHQIMSLVKSLRSATQQKIEPFDLAVSRYRQVLVELKLSVYDSKGDPIAFDKLKVNRSESIQLLSNYTKIGECLDLIRRQSDAERLKRSWQRCFVLLCVAASPPDDFSEKLWLERAKIFAIDYSACVHGEDITTYLHVFVYHFGFFIQQYGGLEVFGNYSVEGLVGEVKRNAKSCAPRYGGSDPLSTLQAVLDRFVRMEAINWNEAKVLDCARTWFRSMQSTENWNTPELWA